MRLNLLGVAFCFALLACAAQKVFSQTNAAPPPNDFFTNRIALTGTSISSTVTNQLATKESREPNHAGNPGGKSVWWTWTATSLGTVTIDTSGSSFDTVLAVYTGSVISNLTLVKANDDVDAERDLTSKVRFNVTPGTNYQIAVDGFSNTLAGFIASGTVALNVKFTPDTKPPIISISSPASGARLTNSTVTVRGTAKDNIEVLLLQARLENVAGTGALQIPDGTNNWSVTFTNLAPGANTVRVFAFDTSSNVSLFARTFSYILVNPAAGNYAGLFFDTNGVAHQSSGFFNAKFSTTGKFSAKILLAGKNSPLSGAFSSSGSASNFIARKGLSPLTVLLQVNSNDTDVVNGTISDGVWNADLTANRATFHSTANPCSKVGKYTLVIPSGVGSLVDSEGFGALVMDAAGKVKLKGALADGTKVSQKTFLSKQNQWPLYASLYSGNGSLLGWLTFTNLPGTDIDGLVSWIKLPQQLANFYPAGFTNLTGAIGSTYNLTNPVLNFSTGEVSVANGNLPMSFTNQIALGIDNKVANLSSNKLTLTITPASGLFKGSAADPVTAKTISFNGALLQKQNSGAGFFLGTNLTGRVTFGP